MIKDFKLIKKINLTQDIFELTFEIKENLTYSCGQFITFILPILGGRAYSMLDVIEGNKIKLIIKRLENGKGGSKYICDSNIGTTLKGVGPAGHFVLRKTNKNKLFIGTGTGFVPLYNQIIGSAKLNQDCNLKLIFGVRTIGDVFYEKELNEIKEKKSNFSFQYCVSREENKKYSFGRVTDYLNIENIKGFEEFYICGNPNMVDDSIKLLLELGIEKDQIFTEKY